MEQFKVGDYVRHKASKSVHKCIYINAGLFKNEIVVTPLRSFNPQYMDNYEPWYPQENEWCWFWNYKIYPPMFGKFERLGKTDEKYIANVYWRYDIPATDDEVEYRYDWKYCEPFIGQLPSKAKEQ